MEPKEAFYWMSARIVICVALFNLCITGLMDAEVAVWLILAVIVITLIVQKLCGQMPLSDSDVRIRGLDAAIKQCEYQKRMCDEELARRARENQEKLMATEEQRNTKAKAAEKSEQGFALHGR